MNTNKTISIVDLLSDKKIILLILILAANFSSCSKISDHVAITNEIKYKITTATLGEISTKDKNSYNLYPSNPRLPNDMKTKTGNKTINSSLKKRYFFNNFIETKKHKLHHRLREISGLSFADNTILTHNDEEGTIFILNPKNGKIINEFIFGKDGDYEGIAVNKKIACIIKSNGIGILYNLKSKESRSFTTALNENSNVEGLCFSPFNKDELLIACKGKTIDKKKHERAIYSFNIATNEFFKSPFLRIIVKKLQKFTKENKYDNKKKLRIEKFAPSGIAIDPKTKYTYIISARGSSLAIFDNKELKDIVFLNTNRLPQPEGICFDPSGNLFISSEGKSKKATLIKFNRI